MRACSSTDTSSTERRSCGDKDSACVCVCGIGRRQCDGFSRIITGQIALSLFPVRTNISRLPITLTRDAIQGQMLFCNRGETNDTQRDVRTTNFVHTATQRGMCTSELSSLTQLSTQISSEEM